MIAKTTVYQNYGKMNKRTFFSRVYCDFACLLNKIRDKFGSFEFSSTNDHPNLDRVREEQMRKFDQSYTTIAHMYARSL